MNQCGQLESGSEIVVLKDVASSSVRESFSSLRSEVDVGRGVGSGRVTTTVVVGRQVRVPLIVTAVVMDEFSTGMYTGAVVVD